MINPKICPFCKEENQCEADIANKSCWCNTIKVPIELRALIPDAFQMKACICKNCILLYKSDKDGFVKKFVTTKD